LASHRHITGFEAKEKIGAAPSYSGELALVTGTSSGIGSAVARTLAAAGLRGASWTKLGDEETRQEKKRTDQNQ